MCNGIAHIACGGVQEELWIEHIACNVNRAGDCRHCMAGGDLTYRV